MSAKVMRVSQKSIFEWTYFAEVFIFLFKKQHWLDVFQCKTDVNE